MKLLAEYTIDVGDQLFHKKIEKSIVNSVSWIYGCYFKYELTINQSLAMRAHICSIFQ